MRSLYKQLAPPSYKYRHNAQSYIFVQDITNYCHLFPSLSRKVTAFTETKI